MQVHVENIPAFPIIYMRRTGAYGEGNFKLMDDMKSWIQEHHLWDENTTLYGIPQDDMTITPPEECRYDVCFVTEQEGTSLHHGTLPSGIYLVFEIPHTMDGVQHFWNSIADVMVKEGKQIDRSRPILERYQGALIKKGYCEFCIPILS